MGSHFWPDLSDSLWHQSFNKEYAVIIKKNSLWELAFRFDGHIKMSLDSVADPDPRHSGKLDQNQLKVKSQGIRLQVRSWILIRILLQQVLQSEKPEAVEALNA